MIALPLLPPENDEEDPRPVKPDWRNLAELVEGARNRGFHPDAVAYVEAIIGLAWRKGYAAGRRAPPACARPTGCPPGSRGEPRFTPPEKP